MNICADMPLSRAEYLEKRDAAVKGTYGDFSAVLEQAEELRNIEDEEREIWETFHVPVHVVSFACDRTDGHAEAYDLAMLERKDYRGSGNVVISEKTLERMSRDAEFKKKVYASIEDGMNGIAAGGMIKSTGIAVHEDGTAGYWVEFDWGDHRKRNKRADSSRTVYCTRPDELAQKAEIEPDDQAAFENYLCLFKAGRKPAGSRK